MNTKYASDLKKWYENYKQIGSLNKKIRKLKNQGKDIPELRSSLQQLKEENNALKEKIVKQNPKFNPHNPKKEMKEAADKYDEYLKAFEVKKEKKAILEKKETEIYSLLEKEGTLEEKGLKDTKEYDQLTQKIYNLQTEYDNLKKDYDNYKIYTAQLRAEWDNEWYEAQIANDGEQDIEQKRINSRELAEQKKTVDSVSKSIRSMDQEVNENYTKIQRDMAQTMDGAKKKIGSLGHQGFSASKAMADPNGLGGLQIAEAGALAAYYAATGVVDLIKHILARSKKNFAESLKDMVDNLNNLDLLLSEKEKELNNVSNHLRKLKEKEDIDPEEIKETETKINNLETEIDQIKNEKKEILRNIRDLDQKTYDEINDPLKEEIDKEDALSGEKTPAEPGSFINKDNKKKNDNKKKPGEGINLDDGPGLD